MNYANIAWAKTNVTKLSEIHLLQQQYVRIVLNEDIRSMENFALYYEKSTP